MNRPSPLRSRRSERGMTLVELMAAAAISSIALLAVGAAFLGVHRSFQSESDLKSAVEYARVGADYIEQHLAMAGYGVDPRFAFDFSGDKDNIQNSEPYFLTDDLAFRYRDPSYLRRGALGSAGMTLVLDETTPSFGVPLRAGQPLLLACAGGQEYLAAKITADLAATSTQVDVAAYGAPFPTAVPSCLRGGEPAYVMLLKELRLRVRAIGDRAWLVAYRNLADPSTSEEYDPIAPDVEAFQVAYVMNRPKEENPAALPPDNGSNRNWILGDAAGEALPNPAQANVPTYDTPYRHASRFNNHPANIRAVRTTLVMRGERRATTSPSLQGSTIVAENGTLTIADTAGSPKPGFQRTVIRTATGVPNMSSRSFFVPALKAAGETTDGNVWGG